MSLITLSRTEFEQLRTEVEELGNALERIADALKDNYLSESERIERALAIAAATKSTIEQYQPNYPPTQNQMT